MTVRVVSAPPEMNSPVSCTITVCSIGQPSSSALAHTDSRSSRGSSRRSSAIGPITAANSMIAPIMSVISAGSFDDAVDAHQPLGPRAHRCGVLVAEAEQVRGHARRERRGQLVDELELTVVDEPVDELVDHAADHRLEPLHRLRREPARDQRPLRVVHGIVLGDHVLFHGRDARAVTAAAREDVGAPLDVDQRRVAHDRPQLVLLVAPHRAVGARSSGRRRACRRCRRRRRGSGDREQPCPQSGP